MPTFGSYETAQRLFLSGVGGIYALKSDDKKIIKVLHPPVGIWSDDRIQEEIDGFRLRAKTQKHLAGTSKYWAPIHDAAAIRDSDRPADETGGSVLESGSGQSEGRPVADGAFAVMDKYERSVQSLIDGRVNVQNPDLRAIFSAVFQGLLDLRQSADRPHGALKASNILLANSADLAAATIHLTDPAPDGALNANSAARDLSDLGRILYHLVNRRAYDEGTIGRNKAWDALGPNGEDWRKLCNSLLDSHAPADERDLEKLLPRIATWTAKPRKSKKPMAFAMVALVLLAGGIVAYIQLRPKPVKFDALAWQNESLAYRAWFEDFAAEVQKPSNRAKFSGIPPRPGEPTYPAIATYFDKDHDFNPVTIAKRTGERDINWEDLIANPNEFVINPPGPKATQDGNTQIAAVTDALAKWPVLVKIDDAAKRYQEAGWQKPAGGLREVSLNARPPVIPPPAHPDQPNADIRERYKIANDFRTQRKISILEGMTLAMAAAKSVDNIDKHWKSITDQLATLHTDVGNVALLKKLPEFAQSIPHSEAKPEDPGSVQDLNDLDASFTKVEALLTTLSAALASSQDVVYTELARDPLAGEDVPPSIPAFEALATVVPRYVKLKIDPRDKVLADWKAGQALLESDMDDYLAKAAGAKVEGIQVKLDQLKARRLALESALAEAAKTVAIVKNSDAISASSADAAGKITQLLKDAEDWSAPFKTDPVQYVKEKHDYILTARLATPSVDAAWKAAYNQYLAKVEATKENLRKDYNYRLSVDDKFKRLEGAYRSIDAAIPLTVPGLSDVAGTDWRHVIAARVATVYRENALKDLLSNLPKPADDVPNLEDAAFVSYRTQRLATFEKTRADTLALLKDYAALNTQLDQLELLPDEPAPGNSWSDLFKKWGGAQPQNPLLGDATIAAALKPISDRVQALLDLNQVGDYKTLLADTQSPAAEIALTAWRKLGTVPVAEDIPALDDEDKAEAAVKARLAALRIDAARAQKLTAEIDKARPGRWHRWADGVVGGDSIAHAVSLARSFGVDISRQSEPVWFYYQQLLNLRAAYQANAASEDALKGPAQDFIKTVTDPPLGDLPNDSAVKALIEEMKKSLSKEQDTSSASKQGPQWANWTMDAPSDQVRIFHSADGKHSLEFQMMSVSEASSQKTVYLCTTEMSVGLFVDSMNSLGRIDDVDNRRHKDSAHWFEVPANKSDDTFYELGVRSWHIVNGAFDLNSKWIDEDGKGFPAQMIGKSVYPENARPQPPAPGDPMQLLSPWSAMYAAQLLGCRLPTTAEWKAAYNQFEARDGLPKNVWNLRGEASGAGPSWRTQQEYAKLHALDNLNFPDKNIFLEDIFYKFQGKDAVPWTSDALARLAPNRITPGTGAYANNSLWFMPVDKEIIPAASAGAPKLTLHHLVGNVAEYAFDGDTATAVVASNKPDPAAIDKTVQAGRSKVFVIGGSSLSAPDIAFNKEQRVDVSDSATKIGFSDVGFRLAYTAPKDSIVQVLERNFRDAKILPGPRRK